LTSVIAFKSPGVPFRGMPKSRALISWASIFIEATRIRNKDRKIFIISNIYLKNNVLVRGLRIHTSKDVVALSFYLEIYLQFDNQVS
jgi:hypothetical protein